MPSHVPTIIVGGGQAGLATSYYLGRAGIEHIVLEQAAQAANVWRTDRWDSFCLNTPNWTFRLPGAEYDGSEPDAFMPREEIVSRLEAYIERYRLPVRYDTRVTAVTPRPAGRGYLVHATDDSWTCDSVIIATGFCQQPRIPAMAAWLPPDIVQLASGQYRSPAALPPGAVLVVGSGQSGCQIAEELNQSGRRVYLSVGRVGRVPRRYRGKDTFEWLSLIGFFDQTPEQLPSPANRFDANPQISGTQGGHTINLHQFAHDGITLLGRLQSVHDGVLHLADDLHANLTRIDQFEAQIVQRIDTFIARQRLDTPPEDLPQLRHGYDAPLIETLDLRAAGITSVIWSTGYLFDFSLVELPVTDGDGFPRQTSGVTEYPGLYFVGLPWLPSRSTGLFLGLSGNAAHVASHITGTTAA